MCLASTCVVIALGPGAAVAQAVETARVIAEPFPLTAEAPTTTIAKIWADKLPALIAQQKALVKSVPSLPMRTEAFIAKLKTSAGTYIVSAINSGECHSTPGVQNERICPARLALLTSQGVQVIAEQADFPIAMVRGIAGFDASSNAQNSDKTIVTFNPTTKAFAYELFHGGRSVDRAPVFTENKL